MTTIQEYLGSLIAGVNEARVLADIKSASIAQMYAKDDLLKHFTVPRFRATEVELSIPLATVGLQEEETAQYQPIDRKSFNSAAYQTVKRTLKVASIDRNTSQAIQKQIAARTTLLIKNLKSGSSLEQSLRAYTVQVATEVMKHRSNEAAKREDSKREDSGQTKSVQETLAEALYTELRPKVKEPEKALGMTTEVIVEAAKLRELQSENLVHIKMKISEEGMEWTAVTDEEGRTTSKLIPE